MTMMMMMMMPILVPGLSMEMMSTTATMTTQMTTKDHRRGRLATLPRKSDSTAGATRVAARAVDESTAAQTRAEWTMRNQH
jgi:hypothetical protein